MSAVARSMSDERDGPGQLDERLAELGLKREYLEQAIWSGVRDRRLADEFEPGTAAGLRDWMGRVRELRKVLAENGWRPVNPANAPFSRSPDGSVLLGVMLGNQHTGRPGGRLESTYPKGTAIENLTAHNDSDQYSLPEIDALLGLPDEGHEPAKAWFLVTFHEHDQEGRVTRVRYEIAQPAPSRADQKIDNWAARYCLRPVEFPPIVDLGADHHEPIDVRVARR
ncbi:hypothetical protein [Amycolatopsis aidingensis]|uniref:hypothetical protein n=1 Tax=Amycolatopsis aidingensis TaxID=2842453 RepID=UPI001C0DE0B1|nr:hypothetical protein [Amycolatopsis aidingensis]